MQAKYIAHATISVCIANSIKITKSSSHVGCPPVAKNARARDPQTALPIMARYARRRGVISNWRGVSIRQPNIRHDGITGNVSQSPIASNSLTIKAINATTTATTTRQAGVTESKLGKHYLHVARNTTVIH